MGRPRTCLLKSLNCLPKPAVMSVGLIFIEGKSRQSTELQISGDGGGGINITDRLLLSFFKIFFGIFIPFFCLTVLLQVARVFYYLSAAALQYLAPTILLLFSVLMLRTFGGFRLDIADWISH